MRYILSIGFIFIGCMAMAQQPTFKGAFLEKWNNSRDYIIEVAEAMPEEHYDFKPTLRQKSFREQLIHITGNINWLSETYFTNIDIGKPEVKIPKTKSEIIAGLKKAFDVSYTKIEATTTQELTETVDFFAGPKSKLQILNLMQDHVTHHRGQLLVYLNLKEIIPPGFSGW